MCAKRSLVVRTHTLAAFGQLGDKEHDDPLMSVPEVHSAGERPPEARVLLRGARNAAVLLVDANPVCRNKWKHETGCDEVSRESSGASFYVPRSAGRQMVTPEHGHVRIELCVVMLALREHRCDVP